MASRSLTTLDKRFRAVLDPFLASVKADGIEVLVYCTKRGHDEQARLWRQGRSGRVISNTCLDLMRRGERAVDEGEDGGSFLIWQALTIEAVGPQYQLRQVTNAMPGDSAHNWGLAVDLVPVVDGNLAWADERLWERVGVLAEAAGVEWSGRWTSFVEKTHFQMPGWRDIAKG
jgi:hypothetical protein